MKSESIVALEASNNQDWSVLNWDTTQSLARIGSAMVQSIIWPVR